MIQFFLLRKRLEFHKGWEDMCFFLEFDMTVRYKVPEFRQVGLFPTGYIATLPFLPRDLCFLDSNLFLGMSWIRVSHIPLWFKNIRKSAELQIGVYKSEEGEFMITVMSGCTNKELDDVQKGAVDLVRRSVLERRKEIFREATEEVHDEFFDDLVERDGSWERISMVSKRVSIGDKCLYERDGESWGPSFSNEKISFIKIWQLITLIPNHKLISRNTPCRFFE